MDIRAYLHSGKPLLFDGAMNTYFASLPHRAETRCELANLDHPNEILNIHQAYLEAGAKALRTNTFYVSSLWPMHPIQGKELIQSGCVLAREAAGSRDAFVFADIGPAPLDGRLSPAEIYIAQAEQFLALGVTNFVVETLSTDEGVAQFARELKRKCPEAFLLVSFAVSPDGITREGFAGRALFERAAAIPEADGVGFNCLSGPHHLLELVRSLDLKLLGDKVLSVMPNAGYPTVLGRRVVYQGKPEYFGFQTASLALAGAAIVGGCCGTTPAHIVETSLALEKNIRPPVDVAVRVRERADREPNQNSLREKLEKGQRVVAVELDPPADDKVDSFLEGVRVLQEAGADAITISDCPVGRPRADSSLLACKLRRELGVDPLPHMTCRDRNLNAAKALLLGLSMEGVHNVLIVTGDPVAVEYREQVKSVFNFNARKMIRYVSELNDTTMTTPFYIFGALNVNAANFDMQLQLALEKEEAGVHGFLTQPVHSPRALDNLRLARRYLRGKLLGGVFPVVSHRNALFLNNEVTGVYVPEEMVALYRDKSREEAEDLAVELSVKLAEAMRDCTDGLYLMTPFRRVELIRRIMEQVK